MTPPLYTALGKEVLRDDRHFADLVSPAAAEAVAAVLNSQVLIDPIHADKADRISKELWG